MNFSNHQQKRCRKRERSTAPPATSDLKTDSAIDQDCRWPKEADRLQRTKMETKDLNSTHSPKELNSANNMDELGSDAQIKHIDKRPGWNTWILVLKTWSL